ncbi:MAG TPA: DHHA1 domain-containing protein [Methanomassiliicoccales archaeon]|jgi:alanyl-tRNA synthetase|nr:DHHA1 domain-containing protein [Methanomassiliicoccales archaeon]HQM66311.1 DHHA1 domain-containing protein [Methanomassiliicoccales archaeon]
MTLRLYESDPYLKEFDATVTKVEGEWVVLDRTAFYPGGGGQERDQGTLAGLPVLGMRGKDEIAHRVPGHAFTVGDKVHGTLDWENRYALMRAHTGEHLLFSSLSRRTDMELVKISLARERKVLVVKGHLDWGIVREAVQEVNSIIAQGAKVSSHLVDREGIGEGGPRAKLDRISERMVRVVSIGEHDHAACAGVHLGDAREIGMLLVNKFTSAKPAGDWEIEFLVGPEAVRAAVDLSISALMLGERMGALPQDSLTAFDNRERELNRAREALKVYGRTALASLRPRELGPWKVFTGSFLALDRRLVMEWANELVAIGGSVAVLVCQDERTFLVLARSPDVDIDCVTILREALAPYGGRGGGKPAFASGGTSDQVDPGALIDGVLRLLK